MAALNSGSMVIYVFQNHLSLKKQLEQHEYFFADFVAHAPTYGKYVSIWSATGCDLVCF